MVDYQETLILQMAGTQLFQALQTADGLKGWWTQTVQESPGRIFHLGFPHHGQTITIQVLPPSHAQEVRWLCLKHSAFPEWDQTSMIFQWEETPKGVNLDFCHRGLTPQLQCFTDCREGWNYFLESLQLFLETGKGTPYGEVTP